MRTLLFLMLVSAGSLSAVKLADKAATIMFQAVTSSRTGQMARMCSCQEQAQCIASDTQTMRACSQQCYGVFNTITRTPYSLQTCLNNGIADQITGCMTGKMFTCGRGGSVYKYNYQSFYGIVLGQIQSRKGELTNSPPFSIIKPVASAGIDFATCALNCFVRANPNRCFDSFGCQPQVNTNTIKRGAKMCFKQMEKQAGNECYCMLNAGVTSLQNFCALARGLGMGK